MSSGVYVYSRCFGHGDLGMSTHILEESKKSWVGVQYERFDFGLLDFIVEYLDRTQLSFGWPPSFNLYAFFLWALFLLRKSGSWCFERQTEEDTWAVHCAAFVLSDKPRSQKNALPFYPLWSTDILEFLPAALFTWLLFFLPSHRFEIIQRILFFILFPSFIPFFLYIYFSM